MTLLARFRRRRAGSAEVIDFEAVFSRAPIGMALFDLRGPRAGYLGPVNDQLCQITGYIPEQLRAMTVLDLYLPAHRVVAQADLNDAAAHSRIDGPVQREREWRHAEGHVIWVAVSASVLPGGQRSVLQVIDITERKDAEKVLTRQALFDPLTGLANRTLLEDHLTLALLRCRRQGSRLALLYLDLDDFKQINDNHGHAVGDAVLKQTGERIRSCLRETDTAARLGGDEFLVIYEDVADDSDVQAITKRIEEAMVLPMAVGNVVLTVASSIGVTYGHGRSVPDEMIRQADAAMYVAKRGGKGRTSVADLATVARVARHVLLDQELRQAVELSEFVLHYQPVVELATSRVIGVEALLRWQHPTRGLLGPGQFLDVAEDCDLIVPIGRWALRAACAQGAAWHRTHGPAAPTVAVNVASKQFGAEFVDDVGHALVDHDLPGRLLVLEVTERQILNAAHSVQTDLTRLTDGSELTLSLDDFGTGFSTFDYLRRYPFSTLKIDQSFVQGLDQIESKNLILVKAILAMSEALGLAVVAEGVETAAQRMILTDLGCTYAQGYHLHRPMAAAAISRLLDVDPHLRTASY